MTAKVIANFERVCELWASGKSMAVIAEEMDLRSGPALWHIIHKDAALLTVLEPFRWARSQALHEQGIDWAFKAALRGDYRTSIETVFKVAARMNPEEFGELKVIERRDKNGKVIGSQKEIGSASSLTPGEAYAQMLEAGAK